MGTRRKKKSKRKGKPGRSAKPYPFEFRLKVVKLFLDDYSRYITGLGFYRSQTAENVIETYRRAAGEYGVPKEMLTDNGRQYTNWGVPHGSKRSWPRTASSISVMNFSSGRSLPAMRTPLSG